jgi:sporulation protein YlmC with PRC-barrel domain
MHVSSLPLGADDVVDADRQPVGRVVGSELTENTREPSHLLIEPSPDLQEAVGEERGLWVDFERIASIRRDGLVVDATIQDLVEAER